MYNSLNSRMEYVKVGIAVLLGVGIGLFIGWVIWPVQVTNGTLDDLRPDLRAEYVAAVADAYVASGGQRADVAMRRLNALEDPAGAIQEAILYYQNNQTPDSKIHQTNLRFLAARVTEGALPGITQPVTEPEPIAEAADQVSQPPAGWFNLVLALLSALVLFVGGIWIAIRLYYTRTIQNTSAAPTASPIASPQPTYPRPDRQPPVLPASRTKTSDRSHQPAPWEKSGPDESEITPFEPEDTSDVLEMTPRPDSPTNPSQGMFSPGHRAERQDQPAVSRRASDLSVGEQPAGKAGSLEEPPDPPVAGSSNSPRAHVQSGRTSRIRESAENFDRIKPSPRKSIEIPEPRALKTTDSVLEGADKPSQPDLPRPTADSTSDNKESVASTAIRLADSAQSVLSSLWPRSTAEPSPAGVILGEFVAHYYPGIPDYDESFSILVEKDGKVDPLGSCGMGTNHELDGHVGGGIMSASRGMDVWLYDRQDIRSYSQLLVSKSVSKHQFPEQSSNGTVTGAPLVAEPGVRFKLQSNLLVLDCEVVKATTVDSGPNAGAFAELQVKMTVYRRRGRRK